MSYGKIFPTHRHIHQGWASAPEHPAKRHSVMIPFVIGDLSHLLFENALISATNRLK
jgi:hypothetical protein